MRAYGQKRTYGIRITRIVWCRHGQIKFRTLTKNRKLGRKVKIELED